MNTKRIEHVEGLSLSINNQEIGVVSHYSGGKNIFVFSPEYTALPSNKRNTFTMSQLIDERYLHQPLISAQRLPPVLSNLLPEGALRDWMSQSLKVHVDNEYTRKISRRYFRCTRERNIRSTITNKLPMLYIHTAIKL